MMKRLAELDELLSRLDNSQYKKILSKKLLKKQRHTKRNKDYELVYEIFLHRYGYPVFSKTTLWRIIVLREKYPEEYKKIIKGESSIRTAFDNLEPQNVEEPNFKEILNSLKNSEEQLVLYKFKYRKPPNLTELRQIDNILYRLRRLMAELSMYYDDDYEWTLCV